MMILAHSDHLRKLDWFILIPSFNKQGAASMAKKKITVLRQAGAACDHPIDPTYPEGAYLSNILLRVL